MSTIPVRPSLGEKTRKQARIGVFDIIGMISNANPWARLATYETYRMMRLDPTIELARAIATMPIRAAEWSVEADEGVPEEWVELVKRAMDPLMHRLLIDMVRALDFGWASFEIVWHMREGRIVPKELKPLLHDITEILIEVQSGRLWGVRNTGAELQVGRNALVYTHDGEGANYYGRSRLENIRSNAWKPWLDVQVKAQMYFAKAAGIIPIVRYPAGESPTVDGGTQDNSAIAETVLNGLGSGKGMAIPWELQAWAEEALNRGVNPADLQAWQIDFLETESGHGQEFLGHQRYYDSLKMRGYLVPERAGTEGQTGTKAEAETHGDLVVAMAWEVLRLFFGAINAQVVDPTVVANFGSVAAGKVRLMPSPIVDEQRDFVRQLVDNVLSAPGNLDLMLGVLDFDAMLDEVGLPKAAEVVNPLEVRERTRPDPFAPPGADPEAKPAGTPQDKPVRPPITAAQRQLIGMVLSRIGLGDHELRLNCGTGAGGFQPGNDCGVGDGSGSGGSYRTSPTGSKLVSVAPSGQIKLKQPTTASEANELLDTTERLQKQASAELAAAEQQYPPNHPERVQAVLRENHVRQQHARALRMASKVLMK